MSGFFYQEHVNCYLTINLKKKKGKSTKRLESPILKRYENISVTNSNNFTRSGNEWKRDQGNTEMPESYQVTLWVQYYSMQQDKEKEMKLTDDTEMENKHTNKKRA